MTYSCGQELVVCRLFLPLSSPISCVLFVPPARALLLQKNHQNITSNNNNNNNNNNHALNDLVARSFASAGVPVSKEPVGLLRSDGKRPHGVTLVPWQSGKSLCWDATVTCPLAESYVDRAASEAGAAAEMAATRKEEKYVDLSAR